MSEIERTSPDVDQHVELAHRFDQAVIVMDGFGLVLDLDSSDVNAFDSQYAYKAEREDDAEKLVIRKFDLNDFHGAPVTTTVYAVSLIGKQVDAEGLRLLEKFEVIQDKVTDETQLGDKTIELTDPDSGITVSISGDFCPQPDRAKHRLTLGEFDENGDFMLSEPTPADRLKSTKIFRESEALVDHADILGRLENVLGRFAN